MDPNKVRFIEMYIVTHIDINNYNHTYPVQDKLPSDLAALYIADILHDANVAWEGLEKVKANIELVDQFPELNQLFKTTY